MTEAKARHTDPETSHEAAASVTGISTLQRRILQILAGYTAGNDDQGIIEAYVRSLRPEDRMITGQNVRSRRAELVALGYVRHDGYGTTRRGRRCRLWRITIAGRQALEK